MTINVNLGEKVKSIENFYSFVRIIFLFKYSIKFVSFETKSLN